jgi:hypothetical protein
MKKVTYQIGVDILGFPIYMEHSIYEGVGSNSVFEKPKHWVRIIQKLIKQH